MAESKSTKSDKKHSKRKKSSRKNTVSGDTPKVKQQSSEEYNLWDQEPTGIIHKTSTDECPISKVTVYADRAEITRKIDIDIEKEGIQDIVIHNMLTEAIIRKDSISVRGGDKKRIILEVSYERSKRVEVPKDQINTENLPLREKKKELSKARSKLSAESNRIKKEKKWVESYSTNLLSPTSKDGVVASSPISIETAREFMAFYKTELERLDNLDFALQAKNEDLDKQIKDINDEIKRKRPIAEGDKSQVTISLAAQKTGKVSLLLSYVILGASWESVYDARVDSKQKTIGLVYNAMITNTTGENWDNIDLFLSTAVPSIGGEPPLLVPLKVDWKTERSDFFASKQLQRRSSVVEMYSDESSMDSMSEASIAAAPPPQARGKAIEEKKPNLLTAGVEAGATSATYQIRRKSTIESDNKPHKVTVAFIELDARFEYVVVPTKSNNAYYKAVATNMSAYQLLDGKMNVFVDNFFVANSRLLNTQPGATFKLYLGVDNGIKVDCKPTVSNKGKGGMFTKTKHETTTRTAVIKNCKSEDVAVLVFFQLPFSSTNGIKVKLEEPSKSDPNVSIDAYSLLKTRCEIAPGKEIRAKISYSIDFPADKEIEFRPQRGNPQGM